jgi:hypothetical protein
MVATLDLNRSSPPSFCQTRGYCGPFLHAERYSAVPGWNGFADCAICGNTVQIERHKLLWRKRLIFRGTTQR